MTADPLSMLELVTELMSCGNSVSVVVLSKKGGLMQEINRRRIKSGGTPETRNGLLEVQKAFREAGLNFSKQVLISGSSF
ncbi:hypothetical protein FRX31_015663 [Thalictrum thalictroides]|uniref:Uncharacterized protein n=1 Tax=Thalictrum thalictroides TaxID=46969 RepID=A0A7J6WDR5_THATH|nr:hypothetical protein FRX31_015663 [Thalictrum thalictroides]